MVATTDYFVVEDLLSTEEKHIRDVVARFVRHTIFPQVGTLWLEGRFPRELVGQLANLGIFGATLPEKYGGSELSPIAYGLMMQELEYADSGLRSFASVQSGLAMYAIYRWGSEEQRLYWLPRMAQGEVIGCFGLTEPDAGSDPGSMRTRARKTDQGWVLSGAKRWITNGSIAHVAIIWARDEDDTIRGFIIPTDTSGFSAQDIKTKISMRMSVTSDLHLDDVVVPFENQLPLAEGLSAPLSCLTQARYGIAWGTVGAAQACFDEALNYTSSRIVFSRAVSATQLVQERLTDMISRIVHSQLVAYRLGQLYQSGRLRYPQVSLAKRDNARNALKVARMARELLGGNGISVDYSAMRHLANLETVDTYEGTYEIHTLIVGRDLTQIAAF